MERVKYLIEKFLLTYFSIPDITDRLSRFTKMRLTTLTLLPQTPGHHEAVSLVSLAIGADTEPFSRSQFQEQVAAEAEACVLGLI